MIVVTEWNEFKQLDLKKVKELMNESAVIVDGRNIYEPAQVRELGFTYRAMGRGYNGTGV